MKKIRLKSKLPYVKYEINDNLVADCIYYGEEC